MDNAPSQAMDGLDLGILIEQLRKQDVKNQDSEHYRVRKNCEACQDTGWRYVGPNTVVQCECIQKAKAQKRLQASGLSSVIEELTFESFDTEEDWQRGMYNVASSWTQSVISGDKPWMFFGGAVGSGKTHLCTAACGALLSAGIGVHYMLWPSDSRRLRACVNDIEAFDEMAYQIERARILYIDDLFKTERGAKIGTISTPEVKVAFEILDARNRMNLPTIISTEWLMSELLDLDEGTFSRVYRKSRGYIAEISRVPGRNMRIK